jgi:hypothetical protein
MLKYHDKNKSKNKDMQFKVPQNVQREDTIIGPLTLRQMIIVGIGGGIAYAIYVSLAKTYFMEIWLPPVAIVSALTAAFAFLKIHNLPFHFFLMYLLEYHLLPKKRIWIQGTGTPFISPFETIQVKQSDDAPKTAKKTTKSINELASVVDSYSKSEKTEEKTDPLKLTVKQ